MTTYALPRTLTLPSGARTTLRGASGPPAEPGRTTRASPLFAAALRLFDDGAVDLDPPKPVRDLPLGDFHLLRAVLTKAGWLAEDEVVIDCHNCGAALSVRPCARLETGPWEDDELGDPELDRTLAFETAHPIERIALGRVRQARTVTFARRTVGQALPLFAALSRPELVVDADLVEAMGIIALGATTDRRKIAHALADCSDAAFTSVTDAFLASHYPLRLGADVFCTACKARNTVDAPAEREFDLGRAAPASDERSANEDAEHPPLPPLAEFVELAHAIAEPLVREIPGDPVEVVVEDGTPAVDDGGEPLLGSYMPPPPQDAPTPTRPPMVTLYYRTFEAIERDEGRYDWEGELRETIEHELEHHVYFLRGDDPMDAEERAEIDREAVRVIGKREATRRTLAVFGDSGRDFFVRAWPLVLIAALVLLISIAESRCAP